jgi:nicotinamide mononucleotide transporter
MRHDRPLVQIARSLCVAVVLTSLSYLVGFAMGWITELNGLEVFAVFTSYSCTYLCVVQSRWNYPMGLVTTVAYSVLFWQQGLLASAALNVYLPFALLYGWFRWGPDGRPLPVRHLDVNWWLLGYVGFTAGTYLILLLILRYFGTTLPAADTAILIGSIVAQFLLDNKRIETWAVWAVVNVLAIVTYWQAGLPLVALQYVFFLGNTVYGYACWWESMKIAQPKRGGRSVPHEFFDSRR